MSQYDHTRPDDSGRGWEIYVQDTGEVIFRVNDGERDCTVRTQGQLPVDRWVHLVCVSEGEGGRIKVYIDDRLDAATSAGPGAVRDVPVGIFVGRYPSGGRPFEGWLAELRMSGGVCRSGQVPTAPVKADAETLILWQPSQGIDTLVDRGSSKADLQLVNVKTWEAGPLDGLTAVRLGERAK